MEQQIKATEQKMEKTISALEREFASIRAGRASASVLDKVTIDYYGVATPIAQVASVSVSEARTLIIQPWDTSIVSQVEKAIQASDIGINPVSDGRILRLNFPPLTEERRKEIVKEIKKMAEDSKVAVRNARRDALDKIKAMKKASQISEDDERYGEEEVQSITDKFVKKIDSLTSDKEKEVLEI